MLQALCRTEIYSINGDKAFGFCSRCRGTALLLHVFQFRWMESDKLSNRPGYDHIPSARDMIPIEYAQICSTLCASRLDFACQRRWRISCFAKKTHSCRTTTYLISCSQSGGSQTTTEKTGCAFYEYGHAPRQTHCNNSTSCRKTRCSMGQRSQRSPQHLLSRRFIATTNACTARFASYCGGTAQQRSSV